MPFPVEERFLSEAESTLGRRLPDAYRARLQALNGGDLETPPDRWQLYPVFDKSDRKRLQRTCNHVVLETENANKWPGFPKDAVAVGSNGAGDQLVFLPDPADPTAFGPTLYWWDHETGDVHLIVTDVAQIL